MNEWVWGWRGLFSPSCFVFAPHEGKDVCDLDPYPCDRVTAECVSVKGNSQCPCLQGYVVDQFSTVSCRGNGPHTSFVSTGTAVWASQEGQHASQLLILSLQRVRVGLRRRARTAYRECVHGFCFIASLAWDVDPGSCDPPTSVVKRWVSRCVIGGNGDLLVPLSDACLDWRASTATTVSDGFHGFHGFHGSCSWCCSTSPVCRCVCRLSAGRGGRFRRPGNSSSGLCHYVGVVRLKVRPRSSPPANILTQKKLHSYILRHRNDAYHLLREQYQ